METTDKERDRLQYLIEEVESRVESLRQQALLLNKEKESILELLQDFQDGPTRNTLSGGIQEDFEYNIERLVLRCLTVEVSVSTPRNEMQEDAFATASTVVEDIRKKMIVSPISHKHTLESHLNACLPEPLSSNINLRFQEKLLGCTAEDQKYLRKQLEKMYLAKSSKVTEKSLVLSSDKSEVEQSVHTNGDSEQHNACDTVVDGNDNTTDAADLEAVHAVNGVGSEGKT